VSHHSAPGRVPHWIERWFGVRPDEERDAFASFAVLFGIMGGHTMLETARDALFLTHLPASQLPFVYLGSAATGILLTVLDRKLARRASSVGAISIYLFLGAILTGVFLFTDLTSSLPLYGLYLWSTIFASWATLQFSLVTSSRFDVGQAKRVLGFIGAGAIVGSVFGATVARAVVEFLPVRSLIGGASVIFVLTAIGPLSFLRRGRKALAKERAAPLRHAAMQGATAIARDSYARLLLLLLLASTVALTVGDFSFKAYARSSHAADLGSFFATTQIVVNALALVVQLLLVPRVLRGVGAHGALLFLPFLLGLGGVGFLMNAALVGALVLRGADGALRFSLHKTAFDLLYFPLSEADRRRIKPALEVLGQRGGQALAAVGLLALEHSPRNYPIFVLFGAILLWAGAVGLLRAPYVRLVRESLLRGDLAVGREVRLDLRAFESAVAALSGDNEAGVRLAIDLLAGHRDGTLVPTVMLLHPNVKVVLHTLEMMAREQRRDAIPIIDQLLSHADPQVRAGALRARAQLAPDPAMLRRLLLDPRREVAATALVALAAHGWMQTEGVEQALEQLRGAEGVEVRLAVARAALVQPSPSLVPLLSICMDSEEVRVIEATTLAMEAVPHPSFIPMLLPLLERSRHRETARRALAAIGQPALEVLIARLRDPGSSHLLRRHLPESIRRFPSADALPVLVELLGNERDGMVAFKVLRSLNRMRAIDPTLPIPEELITREIEKHLASAFRYTHVRSVLLAEAGAPRSSSRVEGEEVPPSRPPESEEQPSSRASGGDRRVRTAAAELLLDVLRDKRIHAAERCMRLINLLLPDEDFRPLMRGYASSVGRVRASALEVIGAVVPARYRVAVLALLDEDSTLGTERVLAAAAPFYEVVPLTYEGALRALMNLSGTTLRAIAAYHATEIGLADTAPTPVVTTASPSVHLLEALVRRRAAAGATH
jgi:AAA family ATP:ADP antiporter